MTGRLPVKRRTHSFFPEAFRNPRPPCNGLCPFASRCICELEFAPPDRLDFERVKLLSDALQRCSALYPAILRSAILAGLPFLLLGFLRSNNALLPQRNLEPLQLGRRHYSRCFLDCMPRGALEKVGPQGTLYTGPSGGEKLWVNLGLWFGILAVTLVHAARKKAFLL